MQHASGDPRAHSLFDGVEYTPEPRVSPRVGHPTAPGERVTVSRKDKDDDSRRRVLLEGTVPGGWIIGVLAAMALIFVVAIIGFSAVNNMSTCELCHLVQPEVDTYKRSSHYQAGVGCQQCHTKPGVFNYVIRNLQGVTNLILYVSNTYERPLTTMVGTNNCVQCHPKSEIERDQVFGDIRVNHTGLREAGYQCVTCHANISHPGTQLEVARMSQNKMPICARCHDGKQLPDDCSTCHVGGRPPADINVPMTEPRHRSAPAVTRERCVCEKCHNGLAMPHPARWIKQHGPIVNERGKKICVECHLKNDPRFCIDCHGVGDPAPERLDDAALHRGPEGSEGVREVPRQGLRASPATACRCRTRAAGRRSTRASRCRTRRSAASATAASSA